jgi:hypothetical protein
LIGMSLERPAVITSQGTNGYGGIFDSDILKSPNPVHGRPDGKNGYTWSHLSLVPHNVDP